MTQDKAAGQPPPLDNSSGEQSPGEWDGLGANRKRNLQLLHAGSLQLAIFQEEIATIVEWREPAPLPYAPKSVLGVVCIQGRMLTVLDLAILLNTRTSPGDGPFQHIVALRGDEQLALAVETLGETIAISDGDLEVAKGLISQIFKHGNDEVNVLNTKELFASALQGRERRRRRF